MKNIRPAADFSPRYNASYLLGVYLAGNAVRDCAIVADGMSCLMSKAEFVFGNHDMFSTLLSPSGGHRLFCTMSDPVNFHARPEERIGKLLKMIGSLDSHRLLLLTGLPMAHVAGIDYVRVARSAGLLKALVAPVPPGSLSGDWLDGYADALDSIAEVLPPGHRRKKKGSLALVGSLFDRNEGDNLANVEILRSLAGELGLEASSVWLSGGGFDGLAAAAEAGTVVSMPYGEKAAARLASRTGAALAGAPLPFGLEGTCRWIRAVAKAAGREALGEKLARARSAEALRRIKPMLGLLEEKRTLFCGDPYAFEAYARFVLELGMEAPAGLIMGRKRPVSVEIPRFRSGIPLLLFEPRKERLDAELAGLARTWRPDLIISNSFFSPGEHFPGCPALEFGFPSYRRHCASTAPFLGFEGAVNFANMLFNALSARL